MNREEGREEERRGIGSSLKQAERSFPERRKKKHQHYTVSINRQSRGVARAVVKNPRITDNTAKTFLGVARVRIADLNRLLDRTVTLRLKDGEIAKVKVTFVDEEAGELSAAVMESSRSEHYCGPCALHTFVAADIVSAELSE